MMNCWEKRSGQQNALKARNQIPNRIGEIDTFLVILPGF